MCQQRILVHEQCAGTKQAAILRSGVGPTVIRAMQLLVPFASSLSQGCVHALRGVELPHLCRLLARFSPTVRDTGDEHSFSPPHERALAAALGWQGADGCLPWAARQAAADRVDTGSHAWGLLTPAHLRVATDHVSLVDPAELALDEASSRALLEAVRSTFESEGWLIVYASPLRWYAAHETLRDLPCAAIDRVIGRNVDIWMPPDPRVKLIRRMQSEVQMLFYNHPCNDERATRGELFVNSFWLSGCGVRQPENATPDVLLDDTLRAPALAQDWGAWSEAWSALDAGPIRALLASAERGQPAALSLCGERSAQRFDALPQSAWARLTRGWRKPAVAPLLESL